MNHEVNTLPKKIIIGRRGDYSNERLCKMDG
jgi:hypothetical protein